MNEEKISDSLPTDDLKQVSGSVQKFRTLMVCQKCGFMNFWDGYFVGQYFNCPECGGENTFYGKY